ncbi:MMPL family transporter [Streptomyces xiaopingdaonensis]|uniref:MMPL family transporter n=1 Tax=Streptomyces xiaopingdaonensis TaxID=1565415 RepID=UPI00049492A8|nr:MMPL family transporter [Streptomyces xiaopingdaonensis]
MLGRLASFIHRHARGVLVLAAVAVVAMGALGAGAFGKLQSGGFEDPSSPSDRARVLIDERFGGEPNLVLLVEPQEGGLDSAAVRRAGEKLTAGLEAEQHISHVASYWGPGGGGLVSRDGGKALILAHVQGGSTTVEDRTEAVTGRWSGEAGPLRVQSGGGAALNRDVSAQVSSDLALAETIAVPVTLVLLVLAFGSFLAALLPLAIGLIAVVGTFAELYLLGSVTDVSVFAINLTTALGLGLGIDYGLLLVSRFRERLGEGGDVADALRTTVRTAGRTIVFSSATVVAALSALLLFPQFFLRSFAYAGIGVVAIAALSALVVVPALLSVVGERVRPGRARLPWAGTVSRPDAPFWGRLAALVFRRPAMTALPVLGVLLLVASPLLGAAFGSPDERVLPPGAESRQVSTAMADHFPGTDATGMQIVVEKAESDAALTRYASRLSRLDGVAQVHGPTGTYRDGTQVRGPGPAEAALAAGDARQFTATTSAETGSDAARRLVSQVREVPAPGQEALVGGRDAQLVDSRQSIGDRLPAAIGLVVATTFVLLFLFTGSVVQPLRALVLNGLSLTASIGAMVWVFQEGHLSSLLGFTPMPMDTSMTVLMFCIVFGLSMDYEVFVTSRIKEFHEGGADGRTAVVGGLSRTGRIVTMAAGLLAVSFFAFASGSVSFLQMFGLGSGLAILIDAVAVRGVLVPAAIRLLGPAAWYAPAPLKRLHRRIGLSEEAAVTQPAPARIEERPTHAGV